MNHVKYFSDEKMLKKERSIENINFISIIFSFIFQEILKCNFDGHCQINVVNRRVCSYCRLKKCLKSGMQIEMIRSSRSISKKIREKRKTMTDSSQTISTSVVRLNQSRQVK